MNDYWTADVWALYALVPGPNGQGEVPSDVRTTAISIKLIEPGLGGSDGRSRMGEYGNVTVGESIVSGSTKAGHVYRAFDAQQDENGPTSLLNDTDGPGFYGAVHDRTRFAFMAFPEPHAGKLVFIVNAENQVWKLPLPPAYATTYTPLADGRDSSSTVTGTGHIWLDNARIFPLDPRAAGCSVMD